MWYLKLCDVNGKIEQLITCEINFPEFGDTYKLISKEEYDSLLTNFQNNQQNISLPSDPEILGNAT